MTKPKSRSGPPSPLIGAHVSTAGGVAHAPGRGRAIGATAIQVFTKSPNQWRERIISEEEALAFRTARKEAGIRSAVAHDSYLINLASPDTTLWERSVEAFKGELVRATVLGLDAVVSHPGNYLDDADRGIRRAAEGYSVCLRAVQGDVMVLLETTAGTGTTLGARFEELRELRDRIVPTVRDRVAFCVDTCHLHSAGYDLINDYDGVWEAWDRIIGLDLLRCFHLNDSVTPFGARRDRHALLGKGTMGYEPFRRLMADPRFAAIPKILETPKGEDEVSNDRRMLRLLTRYAAERG
ncbi:MAG: deoxyribonuclease IV [Gemmatimonadales bacterium]